STTLRPADAMRAARPAAARGSPAGRAPTPGCARVRDPLPRARRVRRSPRARAGPTATPRPGRPARSHRYTAQRARRRCPRRAPTRDRRVLRSTGPGRARRPPAPPAAAAIRPARRIAPAPGEREQGIPRWWHSRFPTCHREGLVYNVAAMPAEPSPESVSPESVPPGAARVLAAASSPAAHRVPRTERELNSPTPLTLRLLGVIFLATFFPWVAAKVACNVREAPLREPPELPADVLARQPKDAALELQQRAASGHYREAAELAKGDAAKELLDADARCQAEPQPCAALRAQASHVATRAVLVGRGPLLAEARAESQVG